MKRQTLIEDVVESVGSTFTDCGVVTNIVNLIRVIIIELTKFDIDMGLFGKSQDGTF